MNQPAGSPADRMAIEQPAQPSRRSVILLRSTVALHAAGAVAFVLAPASRPGIIGTLVCNHALLGWGGLWPRSRLLGPNIRQLPAAAIARREIAVTFDDGPDAAVTPRVLSQLRSHGARATFFCIGERVDAEPRLAREIVDQGHSVQNHTYSHRHTFSFYGRGAYERELRTAQDTIQRVTGTVPSFFRAPAGLRNAFLEIVLARAGLRLTSWTRRGLDTVRRDPDRIVAALAPAIVPGGIVLLHDGNGGRARDGSPVVLAALPRVLALCAERGLAPVTLPEAFRQRNA